MLSILKWTNNGLRTIPNIVLRRILPLSGSMYGDEVQAATREVRSQEKARIGTGTPCLTTLESPKEGIPPEIAGAQAIGY